MAGDLVIGGQLGSYLLESVIGRGGMSVVYRAVHSRLGTPVALKVLAPELSTNDAFRERFLREAKMAAGIDHPNVIPIYDTGLHDDSLYIVMRYVSGGDLKALLVTSGPLAPDRAVALLTPIARALDAAHARGLVHRDVKPANILLQRSAAGEVEHVYLSDFGVMKHTASVSGLTGTGALVGTIDYMAPEQIEGKDVSSQTDVYALGCLFYQSITGHVPFQRESEAAALWAHMHEAVEPASNVKRDVPPAVDAVISRALAKDPADRFASCEEFIRACGRALEAGAPQPAAFDDALAGATVAEPTPPPVRVPVSTPPVSDPGLTRPDREPAPAASAPAPVPPAPTPQPVAQPVMQSPAPTPTRAGARGRLAGRRLPALIAAGVVAGGAAAAVVLGSGGSSDSGKAKSTASAADRFPATLAPVPTNNVKGSGSATVQLKGNSATVTVNTVGLLNAQHAMHIHAGGLRKCPPSSAAQQHGGHLAISTTDGIKFYGHALTALTTAGDTSKASILAFARFPNVGKIVYKRTFVVPAATAAAIRESKAVVIIHGIDYNNNGIYDGVLDKSDLNPRLQGEVTAPGLCGQLLPAKTQQAAAGTRVFTASIGPDASDPSTLVCHLPLGRDLQLASAARPAGA